MSSPNYADYLVRQEQYLDLLREAEQHRVVKVLGPHRPWYHVVARRIGAWVLKWNSTLLSGIAVSSPRVAWTETTDTQARLSPNQMANRNH